MLRKSIKTGAVAAAAAAALLVAGRIISAGTNQTANTSEPTDSAVSAAQEAGYIVRSWDGRVALFSDGFSTTPAVQTNIVVAELRDYDKQLLEQGIKAETYEDVLQLLEDFGS